MMHFLEIAWTILSRVISAAVIVGIGLFVVRETLEARRRRRADARKRVAIRTLLAQEWERNIEPMILLSLIAQDVVNNSDTPATFHKINDEQGEPSYVCEYITPHKRSETRTRIRHFHKSTSERVMLDTAMVDSVLFPKLVQAYAAVLLAENVRNALVRVLGKHPATTDTETLKSMSKANRRALLAGVSAMKDLYKECVTGIPIVPWRVETKPDATNTTAPD